MLTHQIFKRALMVALGVGFLSSHAVQATSDSTRADGVNVRTGAEWVSPPSLPSSRRVDIRELPVVPDWKPGDPLIEVPRQFYGDPNAPTPIPVNPVFGDDPLAARQRNFSAARDPVRAVTPSQNFEGIRTTAQPNDPTGDIGTLQYVMSINGAGGSTVAVFNKATGAQVGSNFSMSSLVSGGTCATSGAGDPIVLFDELVNRWVLTEFTGTGNLLCVYLSSSADLSQTQTWTRYQFNFPAFPDYPKYGVWPQAYFVGANENGTAGRRPFYAMDRARMLAGQPATAQRLTVPNLAGFGFQMTQPADLTGSTPPPAGTPGLFMRHRDDEAHNAGTNNPNADFLELFEFNVDWTTPASSAITGPISFTIAEFSSNLNGLSAFEAFPQPSGPRLDPLRETMMHRLVYRRFATHESLVGNFVTDLFLGPTSIYPDDTGAVRWFELRRATQALGADDIFRNGFEESPLGLAWQVYQEGTYAPEDVPGNPAQQADRWMGAIGVDQRGNIGLGFNLVRQSPAISASLRFTARLEGDALGVMTQGENSIIAGTGNTTLVRWGDYSDMGVDPVDGCTFWYVGNYANSTLNPTNARANRIVAFSLPGCLGPFVQITAPVTSAAVCALTGSTSNAAPLTVNLANLGGLNAAMNISFPGLPTGISANAVPASVPPPSGSTQVTLGANNTATAGPNTATLQVIAGPVTVTRDFTLNVRTALPAGPVPSAPANFATGIGTAPTFTWAAVPGATSYLIEAATSNSFATPLFSQTVSATSFVPSAALPTNTQIFWRVRAVNICGNGVFGTVFSFNTASKFCRAPNLAIPDNNLTGVSDDLVVTGLAGNLTNLDLDAVITHTFVGDLRLRLTRIADNVVVNLVTNPSTNPSGACSGDNINATFDDAATVPAQQGCVAAATPTFVGARIPQQALSAFNGQSLHGTWRLTVIDSAGSDIGTLNSWCLSR